MRGCQRADELHVVRAHRHVNAAGRKRLDEATRAQGDARQCFIVGQHRQHQPAVARGLGNACDSVRALRYQRLQLVRCSVVERELKASRQQPLHHRLSHASETDEPELQRHEAARARALRTRRIRPAPRPRRRRSRTPASS